MSSTSKKRRGRVSKKDQRVIDRKLANMAAKLETKVKAK